MDKNIYAFSNHDIVVSLGKRFKEYRKSMGYTQKAIAEKTGVSIFTISSFEKGKETGLSLKTFIAFLRSIGYLEYVDNLLPELPISPKELFLKEQKQNKKR